MANIERSEHRGAEKGKEVQVSRPGRGASLFDEMDRMFDSFFPRRWAQPYRGNGPEWGELAAAESRLPRVDVIDRDEEMLVRAELPGVHKDDLDVSVSDNAVTIKGETRHEEREEKGEYYRCEISHGAFSRTVTLPDHAAADRAKATFRDGVLEMTLPKQERAKRHAIKVE